MPKAIDERWPGRGESRLESSMERWVTRREQSGKFLEWHTRQGSSVRIPAGSAAIAIRSATEHHSRVDSKPEDQSRLLPKQFSAPVLDSRCPPVKMTMQILSVPASQVPRGTKTEWKASTRQQDRCKAPSSLTSLAEPHEARSQGTSGTVPRCE